MLFPTLVASAALALFPSLASAQTNTTGLPTCALTCTLSSLPGTGCEATGVSNITCICTDTQFQLKFFQCQSSSCSPTDLQAALAFGARTCEQNGTPINTAVTPSGFSSTAAGSASATSSVASSAISSVASAASSVASSVSSAAAAGGSASRPAGSASGSAPAAGATQPTSGAVGYTSIVAISASVVGAAAGVAMLF